MRLGHILRRYRAIDNLSLRDLAGSIGIGLATLSRLENGEQIDSRNLMRIFNWLVEEVKQ